VAPVGAGGPSYIVLLARSEIRRRIRASAGGTYLNDILSAGSDSVLHRWDGRVSIPVRVYFPPTTVANFQPSFLDAVRSAFQRWQDAGVPVRFNLDADSGSAEVRDPMAHPVRGRALGADGRAVDDEGQADRWRRHPRHLRCQGATVRAEDVRVLALHEIGHLIGLDHSPDPGDIMYAQPKVRDLSPAISAQLPSSTTSRQGRFGSGAEPGASSYIEERQSADSMAHRSIVSFLTTKLLRTAGWPPSPRPWTRGSAKGS